MKSILEVNTMLIDMCEIILFAFRSHSIHDMPMYEIS